MKVSCLQKNWYILSAQICIYVFYCLVLPFSFREFIVMSSKLKVCLRCNFLSWQITKVFLDGHSNSLVRIIGLNRTSLVEHVGMLDAEEVYLRYSPLPIPESENLDHQDVWCLHNPELMTVNNFIQSSLIVRLQIENQ